MLICRLSGCQESSDTHWYDLAYFVYPRLIEPRGVPDDCSSNTDMNKPGLCIGKGKCEVVSSS